MGDSYDSLFVVLPEGGRAKHRDDDTHEQVKKGIDVPSQCIQHDNTLSPRWKDSSWNEIERKDGRYARRIRSNYQMAMDSFLVKNHWVPFRPAQAFHYNVHLGIDVGGPHNNFVMACIGYGFANPSEELVFLPGQIDINTQLVEPIPVPFLYRGLLELFEELRNNLVSVGIQPNFRTVLFERDGELKGDIGEWSEQDVFPKLLEEFKRRDWLGEDNLWSTVEIMKRAGYWRILRNHGSDFRNPVVGTCVFPFADPYEALLCTTGDPYLPQGTASPIRLRMRDICGTLHREHIVRDVAWEADMCFTKMDMGMKEPWVLHVADTGALQAAKAYRINGVPV